MQNLHSGCRFLLFVSSPGLPFPLLDSLHPFRAIGAHMPLFVAVPAWQVGTTCTSMGGTLTIGAYGAVLDLDLDLGRGICRGGGFLNLSVVAGGGGGIRR